MSTFEYLPATSGALQKERIGWVTITKEKLILADTDIKRFVENNPRRVFLLFVNNGDFRVDISTETDINPRKGIPIPPGGGSVAILLDEDGTMVSQEWYGRTETGQVFIRIVEAILQ